jgi:hypothetical protein
MAAKPDHYSQANPIYMLSLLREDNKKAGAGGNPEIHEAPES